MAGSERIDDIIDLTSTQQQVTKLLEMIASVDEKIKQVGKITVTYAQGGTSSSEIKRQTDELIKVNADMVNMQKALSEQAAKARASQDMFGRSIEENAQQLLRLKASMESYKMSLKEDAVLLKQGEISREEYNKRIAESNVKIGELKLKSSELTSVLKTQQKQQMALTGSMDEMSQRLNLMKNSYRSLNEEQRKSASGMALQKEIQALDARIKDASASLGDFQRNVGNYQSANQALGSGLKATNASLGEQQGSVNKYGSAIKGFASKAWGGLRQLAYVLPGLGIAGIMGVISAAVMAAIESLDLFNSKLNDSKKRAEDLVTINKESAKSYAEQSVKLTILKERFMDAGASAKQKKNVMEELNKEFGDYGVNLKNTSETEDFLVNKTPKFLLMLDTKAKAAAAFGLATEYYKKALEEMAKADKEYVDKWDEMVIGQGTRKVNQVITGPSAYGFVGEVQKQKAIRAQADKERKKAEAEQMKGYDFAIKQAVGYQKKLGEIQRNEGMVPEGKETKTKNVLVSKPIDFSEDQRKADDNTLKAQIEGQKEVLNTRLYYLNQIVGDEKKSYEERELALIESIDLQKQLVDLQSQSELASIKSKLEEIDKLNEQGGKKAIQGQLDEISRIETIEESKRKAEEKTLLNKKDVLAKKMNLLIEEESLRLQEQNIASKATNEKGKIDNKGGLDRTKMAVDDIAKQAQKQGLIVDTQAIDPELKRLQELHEEYKKGKVSLDEYNRQRQKLSEANTLNVLKEHQKILEQQRKTLQKYGEDTTQIEKLIAENTKQQTLLTMEMEDKEISHKLAKNKKAYDDIIHYTREAAGIISEIMDNRFTAEKNAIQDVENAQQQSYEKDVQNIEKSSASEQDKANKLKILEASRQAQKEANAREQKKIDIEKAKFDKAQAILNIILNTASAIVAQLSVPGAGIALSWAAGAIGAAQLAVAASAPLPKYERGRNGGPAEWALTDEKGPELYLEPDGSAYLGNDKPTMRFLQAGTKIIPADQINNYSTLRMLAQLSGPMAPDATGKKIDELKDIMAWQTNKLASAYSERKAPVVNIINQGQWNDYINRSVKN